MSPFSRLFFLERIFCNNILFKKIFLFEHCNGHTSVVHNILDTLISSMSVRHLWHHKTIRYCTWGKVKQTSNIEVACLSERAITTQAYQKFKNCIKLDINILSKLVKINRGLISILSRRCECFFFSLLIKHMSPKKTEDSLWSQTAGTEKALSCIIRPGRYAASPPIWRMEYSAPLLFPMPSFGPRLWWWGKPSPRVSVT